MTKDRVANILRTPHYRPIIDIDVLVEKSLIMISYGTLWMHDLIQELGKEIVRCESPDEPGGRSRLWLKEDILQGLPLALKVLGSFTRDRNLDAWESDLAWKAFKTFVIVQIQQNKMFEISKGCVNHRQFWANGCISLESLLPLKMNDDSGGSLYLLNCFQFVENQDRCDLFSTMLREYFQELRYRESTNKGIFEVFLPGSEVPNWFRHQSVGASINLELPSYLFKQIRGIAFCAIFRHHQHRGYDCYSLLYHIKPDGKDFCLYQQYFSGEFDTFESDHCWFIYLCPSFSIYT